MNILLLVIVGILGLTAFVGYKKGLIKIAVSLLATVLLTAAVGMVSPYISQWIMKASSLEQKTQKKMVEMLLPDEKAEKDELSREQQISVIEESKLPKTFRQLLLENNNKEVYDALGVTSFIEYIGSYIAKVVSDILAFLITLVLGVVILQIIVGMSGVLDKMPVVGGMNRVVGCIVGMGIGLVLVWILFIAVTLLYDTSFGMACFAQIEGNPILNYLYENNFLMKYIIKF